MNRQTLKKLMVKGTMTYIAVFSLVLMVAMPALALMANSVGTREIKDHSIRSADIRNKAVTTDRIAPRAVKRGKIGKRAIRTEHINYMADSKIRYSTKTGYLSIPVAALTPNSDNIDYSRAQSIRLITGTGGFRAAVYLPDGARVIKLRYSHKDNSSGITYAVLSRVSHLANAANDLGETPVSANASAWQVSQDTSIGSATIDNSAYSYYVYVWLSAADINLKAGNIVIDYTYSSPGS